MPRAPKVTAPNAKQLALLHVGKRELGLNDADYRAILHNVAGVESAGDLALHGTVMEARKIHWRDSQGQLYRAEFEPSVAPFIEAIGVDAAACLFLQFAVARSTLPRIRARVP